MNPNIKAVAFLVAGALFGGLAVYTLSNKAPNQTQPQSVGKTEGIDPEEIRVVELDTLKKAAASDVLIIDARPSLFYQRGRIPNAINLAKEYFARDYITVEPVLRKAGAKRFVVYCSEAECGDAEIVAHELQRLGFKHIDVFKGGWKEWHEAGLPEEKG